MDTGTEILARIQTQEDGDSAAQNLLDGNPLSAEQQEALRGQLGVAKPNIAMTARFVFEGDSITSGQTPSTGTPWPTLAQSLPNFAGRSGGYHNVAVSGSFLTSPGSPALGVTQRYSSNVYPLRPMSGEDVFLFLLIGINDIIAGNFAAPSTWLSNLNAYLETAREDGFKIIVCTVFGAPGNSSSQDVMNRYIRNLQNVDAVVDFAAVVGNTSNLELFNADNLHPNTQGMRLLAEAANRALSSFPSRGVPEPCTQLGGVVRLHLPPTTANPTGQTVGQFSRGSFVWWLVGDSVPASPSMLNIMGSFPMLRLSRGAGAQLDSGLIGLTSAGGSIAAGATAANQMVFAGVSGQPIGFATSASGVTQTIRVWLKASGVLHLVPSSTPTHADNTAALAGSLAAGDVYKTATGELRIVV